MVQLTPVAGLPRTPYQSLSAMRKYRRIKREKGSSHQGYQVSLTAHGLFSLLTIVTCYLYLKVATLNLLNFLRNPLLFLTIFFVISAVICFVVFVILFGRRERITTLAIPKMSNHSKNISRKIYRLFNDKQISDVLKLSNSTRHGDEFPTIYIWVSEDCNSGYIAIENIATFDIIDRDKYEQKISGLLGGKFSRFAVVSSELTSNDSYMLFNFEDTLTSFKILVDKSDSELKSFTSQNAHVIKLSNDLFWHSDITPHMSLIARTRAGKSVLAGRYMAKLMQIQGWIVDYNSAKYDLYVKQYRGKSDPLEIVERAEHWVAVMQKRLNEIIEAGKDKYLELPDMVDIGLFFDELGHLNAALELDKTLKKRWEVAINKLTATGGSAGIHVIAISQFATKEGFLPSLARVNCSDAVIMLGGAADSADERKYLMPGFADLPKRSYQTGQGIARIITSGKKWESPHFYETPWFN
ncbi:MAG: cell division protein FtsK [Leuconostoc mesenteroides]